jgi:uncharacterized membrane protein YccC
MNMAVPKLLRLTGAEWLFSCKSFVAAMLAMYLASRAGLDRPFWALMSAYIVANPLAGAVRSKAAYRFVGTLLGSLAALLMLPALVHAPLLLSLALALWVALCLYLSLLDRTPRAYFFMLAGYTAVLIGLPTVDAPQRMFDNAVLRVEEIGLGILCASVVHSVFWPQGLAPSVLGLIDRTLRDGRHWLEGLLQPQAAGNQPPRQAADRRRLAADITQLRLLSTHVPFDATHLRWTAGAIFAMQERVAALTPHLSAVEDRLQALLSEQGELPEEVQQLLAEVSAWLQSDSRAQPRDAEHTQRLRQRLRRYPAAEPDQGGRTYWQQALRMALAQRLEELLDDWQECARLRRDIDAGLAGAALPLRHRRALPSSVLHRDHGMALLSALAAAIAIGICSAFWIISGWSYGYVAVMMAAIFCSFFAALDDPVPAIHGFLKWTLWSIPLSALYVLVLLPLVGDFGMLVLICAPFFLLVGCFIARPANFSQAMPLFFGVTGTLAMHDTANADLVSFVNFMCAQIIGVVIAARTTRLMRSVGAEWSARRIQRATWHELSRMAAAGPAARPDPGYAVRMLDRIGLLAPRLAQAGAPLESSVASDALRDLRIGADLDTLQRIGQLKGGLPLGPVLAVVAECFRLRAQGRAVHPAAPLQQPLDCAIAAAIDAVRKAEAKHEAKHEARPGHAVLARPDRAAGVAGRARRQAVAALVGLRRNLLPHAPAELTLPGPATGVPA